MCDGDVARFNNSKSIRGSYWDAMIHSLLNPLYIILICISYYLNFNEINFNIKIIYIISFFINTYVSQLFSILLYNKCRFSDNPPKTITLNQGILKDTCMLKGSEIISGIEGLVLS